MPAKLCHYCGRPRKPKNLRFCTNGCRIAARKDMIWERATNPYLERAFDTIDDRLDMEYED